MFFWQVIGHWLKSQINPPKLLGGSRFVELATRALNHHGLVVESYSEDRVLFEHRQHGKTYCCSMVDRQNCVATIAIAGNTLIPACILSEAEAHLDRASAKLQYYSYTIINDRRGSVHVITWTGSLNMIVNGALHDILPEMCLNTDIIDRAIRELYSDWLRENHRTRRNFS